MMGMVVDWLRRAFWFNADAEFYARYFPVVVNNIEPRFRPMSRADVKTIFFIEQTAYEFPWSEGTFADCLKIGYSCWVYERAGTILAYGILSYGAGEAHVMNLCVAVPYQRLGYGRLMLEKLVQEARLRDASIIFLEVRPSNGRALSLYSGMGFNEVGMRKAYYPAVAGREDAIVLARDLTLDYLGVT